MPAGFSAGTDDCARGGTARDAELERGTSASDVAALLRGCHRFVHELAVLAGWFVIGIMPGTIVLSPRYALGARLPLRIWRAVCPRFVHELAVLAGRLTLVHE